MQTIETLKLKSGSHSTAEDGLCAMEAVAYFAGEPHTDRPVCACPVLTKYMIKLNDSMPDDERQKLKPYILKLAGTNKGLVEERSMVLAWAAVTVFAPVALKTAGFEGHAIELENLPRYDWVAAKTIARAAADAAVRATALTSGAFADAFATAAYVTSDAATAATLTAEAVASAASAAADAAAYVSVADTTADHAAVVYYAARAADYANAATHANATRAPSGIRNAQWAFYKELLEFDTTFEKVVLV